jgi:uncharacterized pyridoxamine 5'-phosphate oxidase family protein
MDPDDRQIEEFLQRCMVARIATLSRNGRPSVNPLYFIPYQGKIWLGTADWTLAARNVRADRRVSLLFNLERNPADGRVLRVSGQAIVRSDAAAVRQYGVREALKYILTLAGLRNWLGHLRQVWLRRYYTAQSAQKGKTCVIEVSPERFELITDLSRNAP